MSKRKGNKLFRGYAYQAIDHTKKRIIYCDDHTKIKGQIDQLLPIGMRHIIGPQFKGYHIFTQ